MAIIVVAPGQRPQRVERQDVDREEYLQQYVQANPETLPVEELKPGAKLLVIAREFPTDSGPIDALAIDDDGDLYIVETKLAKNPDKRLVIAQMLDYGAALWNGGAESFLASATRFGDIRDKIAIAFSLTDSATIDTIVRNLSVNVETGQFQFIVLMNQLNDRLRNLITFVNSNSRFRILGLEFDFYRHGDIDILIPRLYGAEARTLATADGTRAGQRQRWDEQSFFADASNNVTSTGLAAIRAVYDGVRTSGLVVSWGTGARRGSLNVKDPSQAPKSMISIYSDGELTLNLGWMSEPGVRPGLQSRFLELANERLGTGIVDPRSGLATLPIEEWQTKPDALISIFLTLRAESRQESD